MRRGSPCRDRGGLVTLLSRQPAHCAPLQTSDPAGPSSQPTFTERARCRGVGGPPPGPCLPSATAAHPGRRQTRGSRNVGRGPASSPLPASPARHASRRRCCALAPRCPPRGGPGRVPRAEPGVTGRAAGSARRRPGVRAALTRGAAAQAIYLRLSSLKTLLSKLAVTPR